jgi:hypothetical protein
LPAHLSSEAAPHSNEGRPTSGGQGRPMLPPALVTAKLALSSRCMRDEDRGTECWTEAIEPPRSFTQRRETVTRKRNTPLAAEIAAYHRNPCFTSALTRCGSALLLREGAHRGMSHWLYHGPCRVDQQATATCISMLRLQHASVRELWSGSVNASASTMQAWRRRIVARSRAGFFCYACPHATCHCAPGSAKHVCTHSLQWAVRTFAHTNHRKG